MAFVDDDGGFLGKVRYAVAKVSLYRDMRAQGLGCGTCKGDALWLFGGVVGFVVSCRCGAGAGDGRGKSVVTAFAILREDVGVRQCLAMAAGDVFKD